jgi:hypothetical protein
MRFAVFTRLNSAYASAIGGSAFTTTAIELISSGSATVAMATDI